MGQVLPKAVPKVVEAERFILRDTRGKILADLGTEAGSGGSPGLALYDQNGKSQAGLLVANGSPGLALYDQNENVRAELIAGTSGPRLVLMDENMKTRAVLEQRPASSLVLFDRDGKAIWRAP